MEEWVLLKDIVHEDSSEKVFQWDFIEVKDTNYRIYYYADKDNDSGFKFSVLNWIAVQDEEWNPETTHAEVIFEGTAYFDGIRHLYMGSDQTDNYGYLYYAHVEDLSKALIALQELESKYCRK